MNSWRLLESAWTLTILVVVALIVYALTGCAAPGACIKPAVELPAPVLPLVQAEDLQCLRADVYQALALRDHALQSALRECRAVVDELVEVPK